MNGFETITNTAEAAGGHFLAWCVVCTGKGATEVAVKLGLKAQVGVCLVPGGGGSLVFQQRTWAGVEGLES